MQAMNVKKRWHDEGVGYKIDMKWWWANVLENHDVLDVEHNDYHYEDGYKWGKEVSVLMRFWKWEIDNWESQENWWGLESVIMSRSTQVNLNRISLKSLHSARPAL